ncbi:MAG: hypothetical protein AB7F98_09760 [Novosphingobium sp.]
MKRAVLIKLGSGLLFSLAMACAPAGSVAGLPEGAYVLAGEQANLLLQQCSRGTPAKGESTFQPEASDITAMEGALAEALANRSQYAPGTGMRNAPQPSQPDFAHAPQGWKRQFLGIVRGGRRYIYGNYFPAADFPGGRQPDPATSAVMVCDGGPAFFGAEWDVAARQFTHLAFNGFA